MIIEVNEMFDNGNFDCLDVMDTVQKWLAAVKRDELSFEIADFLVWVFGEPIINFEGNFKDGFTFYYNYSDDEYESSTLFTSAMFDELVKQDYIGKIKDDVYLLSAFGGDAQSLADQRAKEYEVV